MRVRRARSALLLLGAAVLLAALWHVGYRVYLRAAYPRSYAAEVERSAAEQQVSAALIFAVIKNESGFNPRAVSSIGARGLMQLTPETFWWAQAKTHENGLGDDSLFDPAVNIRYGTVVLKRLITEFGREDTALAAYHAGRANVLKWLRDSRYSKDGRTLSSIPFRDTRAYVQRVMQTRDTYASLYHIS